MLQIKITDNVSTGRHKTSLVDGSKANKTLPFLRNNWCIISQKQYWSFVCSISIFSSLSGCYLVQFVLNNKFMSFLRTIMRGFLSGETGLARPVAFQNLNFHGFYWMIPEDLIMYQVDRNVFCDQHIMLSLSQTSCCRPNSKSFTSCAYEQTAKTLSTFYVYSR